MIGGNEYPFKFYPDSCNTLDYFKNLEELMRLVKTTGTNLNTRSNEFIRNLKLECSYTSLVDCKPDKYCMPNTIQILLGRFNDNVGCFYDCNLYYVLSFETYSIFKNDLLIRYMLQYPKTFHIRDKINKYFPIRILVSDKIIPEHTLMEITDIKQYTGNLNPETLEVITDTISIENSKNIDKIKTKLPIFFNYLSDLKNSGIITSREICSLYQYKYYFYAVYKDKLEKTFEPFILVSKFNLKELKEMKYDDNLILLFYNDD